MADFHLSRKDNDNALLNLKKASPIWTHDPPEAESNTAPPQKKALKETFKAF